MMAVKSPTGVLQACCPGSPCPVSPCAARDAAETAAAGVGTGAGTEGSCGRNGKLPDRCYGGVSILGCSQRLHGAWEKEDVGLLGCEILGMWSLMEVGM